MLSMWCCVTRSSSLKTARSGSTSVSTMPKPEIDRAGDEIRREDRGVPAGDQRNGEVEGHDGVHREHQRRGDAGQDQVGHLIVAPVAVGAAPAHGEQAVEKGAQALAGGGEAVAQHARGRGSCPRTRTAPRPCRRWRPRTRPTPAGSGSSARCRCEFGRGNRYHANQTRPTWNSGKMPAQTTAKIVMASAARLIEVRHFWRSRQRMAEIRVPAWPMPIQNTKLTIGQPQLIGLRWPQTPTPVATR